MSHRIYRMTISSGTSYDKDARVARSYEMHFKVSRRGQIRNIRRRLAERGAAYFQRNIHRRLGLWIPLRRIRISFEREQSAIGSERRIHVEGRTLTYQGKEWRARPLGEWELNYARRRRR